VTLDQLKASVRSGTAPDVPPLLRALWHDARGDWDAAHRLAQDVDDDAGAWVHAYLHRKEGDAGNAAYWYDRAHQPVATDALDSEWERLARWLLDRSASTA
jgi:hypothetical protein